MSAEKRKTKPLVSVVMPVHNTKEEYLRSAIESILAQTYKKFELIIVDDCSTQSIYHIVDSYGDSRIHLLRLNTQQGASGARNAGFEISRGKYIAVQDSDDISRPDRLATQVAVLEKHKDVGVLGAMYNVFPSQKEEVINKFGSPEYLKAYALLFNSPFGHSTVMIRRSVLDMVRYDNSVVCDDFKLFLDLIERTNFMNYPKVLVDYRWHDGNISHQKAEQLMQDVCRVRLQAWEKDFSLSEENRLLLEQLMTGKDLALQDVRKAVNILSDIVSVYQKKYCNPKNDSIVAGLMQNIINQNTSATAEVQHYLKQTEKSKLQNITPVIKNKKKILLQRDKSRPSR